MSRELIIPDEGVFISPDPALEAYVQESAVLDLGVRLATEADQSIPSATNTVKTWASGDVVRDDGGYFSDANDGFVIPTGLAGWYVVHAQVSWNASVDQRRILTIAVNGGSSDVTVDGPTTANTWAQQTHGIIYLAVADVVTMECHTASAAAVTITSARFAMVRMGRFF